MKIGIDIGVCRRAGCYRYIRHTTGCTLLDKECSLKVRYVNCRIPKECSYKNLHILSGRKAYRENCMVCDYWKEKNK